MTIKKLSTSSCKTLFLGLLMLAPAAAQNLPSAASASGTPPVQFATTPGRDNDTTLRPLSPEEIPPNLNFYAINPLYREDTPLGWAKERIEETIDRGVVAIVAEGGKVHVSWRLLKTDPGDIAFNLYRSTAEPRRRN
jgi:hypothetical protein